MATVTEPDVGAGEYRHDVHESNNLHASQPAKPRLRHAATIAGTPYYVLMDGKRRIGPKVTQATVAQRNTAKECSPIYGFSDKEHYDKFCINSQLALAPYPLVKGYLRNRTGESGDGLKLVVLDAAGPAEPYLHAATMEAVLEAQENRALHVTAVHHFIFDQAASAHPD